MKHKHKERREIKFPPLETPFLLEDEAARYLRMEERTLENHRSAKTGPPYRRHGGIVIYHFEDLLDWSKICRA